MLGVIRGVFEEGGGGLGGVAELWRCMAFLAWSSAVYSVSSGVSSEFLWEERGHEIWLGQRVTLVSAAFRKAACQPMHCTIP
jgi:hypothetical protein